MITTSATLPNVALGLPIPPYAPHAISVSLPEWRDNVGYEEGEERVVSKMVSGYPRFFISLLVKKLATICEQKYAFGDEKCLLVASRKIAEQCRDFIERRSKEQLGKSCAVRYIEEKHIPSHSITKNDDGRPTSLYIVLFPGHAFPIAKEFWQHTGFGISSRFAARFLALLEERNGGTGAGGPGQMSLGGGKVHNKHYSVKSSGDVLGGLHSRGDSFDEAARRANGRTGLGKDSAEKDGDENELSPDHTVYLEERYGRNLPVSVAASAKRALRRRLAGVLIKDTAGDCAGEPCEGQTSLELGPSSRAVRDVAEGDVYLFPNGMSAIWSAHQCLLEVGPRAKSICFGFPYTDTLKILQKWGPGCHFFGLGVDSDIDEFEAMLEKAKVERPNERPVMALFTEFPSNPLLRSANLPRLRALADKYDFAIVVDETIGNIVNVEVIQYVDIVVSSLSKIFSGESNVMGGSLVLNPRGRYYPTLKQHLEATFEDNYFGEDAIYMERNSRDFKRRVWRINANTEAVCDFLRSYSLSGGNTSKNAVLKTVYYPKYITPENYEQCRKKKGSPSPITGGEEEDEEGGYGGLFSLTFTSMVASEAFFNALQCFKGPSLGTNFTLACPYTILAHYAELDWAAGCGVEAGLVRISLGMEDREDLLRRFEAALKAAEDAQDQANTMKD
ncbi:hypothetical protein AX15_003264 [Amanita polypyramis BW_CC]|nr:hypothetical protein AX15_003264 [Amanita polypyramis BW_CC]